MEKGVWVIMKDDGVYVEPVGYCASLYHAEQARDRLNADAPYEMYSVVYVLDASELGGESNG